MNIQRTTCCENCPFSKNTPKEYLDTMGDNAGRFIGQAIGPFLLPCHMNSAFPEWREHPEAVPLCAGAAKYRANIGVAHLLPEELGRLPEDRAEVFADENELFAHHKGWPFDFAKSIMRLLTPRYFLEEEMKKRDIQFYKIEK